MRTRWITFSLAFMLVLTAGVAGPNFHLTKEGVSITLTEAEARRYGSSSYSSSRSSYSSSSRSSYRSSSSSSSSLWNRKSSLSSSKNKSSYSSSSSSKKPSTTTSKTTKTASGKTYGSSSASKTGSTVKKATATSGLASAAEAKNSKKVMTERQKKAFVYNDTRPNTSVKPTSYAKSPLISNYKPVSASSYSSTRRNYYSSWDRPNYVYQSSSSFGMWDAMFLWMMLDSLNDNNMVNAYYHHQNDPGMAAWRAEANEMAKENAELKAKLDALDAKVAGMNGEVDPSYVPEGVPAAAYMAKSVVTAPNTSKLVVGTGGETGMYYQTCQYAKEKAKEDGMDIECVNTNGSMANAEGLMEGKFHGAFMQADAIAEMARKPKFASLNLRQTAVYDEMVYLLVNRNNDMDDVTDLDGNSSVYTLGGGAKTTLKYFALEDSDYIEVYRKSTALPASEDALNIIANDPKAAAFFVCAPKCGLMDIANQKFGDKLKLLPVNDWSFNDAEDAYGNLIYEFTELDRRYPNLQDAGMFDDGSLETIAVSAVYVMNYDWLNAYAKRNEGGYSHFQNAFLTARGQARTAIGQE